MLGGQAANDYGKVGVYTCPSYPDKKQLICYVNNAWTFESINDKVGSEITGFTRVNRFQHPSESIYFADNEDGPWRPVIQALSATGSIEVNDVWNPAHLPFRPGGKLLNPQRRVASARHGRGPNLLYFDGHGAWRKADSIAVDDWREQRQ